MAFNLRVVDALLREVYLPMMREVREVFTQQTPLLRQMREGHVAAGGHFTVPLHTTSPAHVERQERRRQRRQRKREYRKARNNWIFFVEEDE